MPFSEGLGFNFDIGLGWSPVDLNTADGATGKRIDMSGHAGIVIVVIKAAGTAGQDFAYTVQQHTAYTGGTSADLNVVDHYYVKQETALDNDESWEKFTQTADDDITDAGAAGTSAEQEQIIVIPVSSQSLTAGYTHVSLDAAATVANAQLAACLYIPVGLRYQRKPVNRPNLLRPGAADA
jgi:hypothetical protein